MRCLWCDVEISGRSDSKYCSRKCRQSAWRTRWYSSPLKVSTGYQRLSFAYADPPYPGLAGRYYKCNEVDHKALIRRLMKSGYDGWALSTSARSLRDVLPLCPPEVRVCAWVKPGGAPPATFGLHNVWEPIIVLQGRQIQPGRRDALYVHPARFGGSLVGRKPLKFCAWLFDAMGMLPGDELTDLFPGTGVVSRAWSEISSRRVPATTDASPEPGPLPIYRGKLKPVNA